MNRITLERTVPAAIEQVWRAWTTPEGLATWWWPQLPDTTYEIRPEVGGRYRFHSASAGIGAQGEFSVVEPPRLLESTWFWIGGQGQQAADEVRVELVPVESGTTVTLTHEVNDQNDAAAEGLKQGWLAVLDRLYATPPTP